MIALLDWVTRVYGRARWARSRFYCPAGGLAADHDPVTGRCYMVPGCGR